MDNDEQNPGENPTSIPLFLSLCKTNQPQLQCWAAQISFLLSPLKETWSNCSSFFLLATAFGSQRHCRDLLQAGDNRGNARVVPWQVPTGSRFPWSRRRGEFDVHRKKEKASSHHSGRWGGDRKHCLEQGTPRPAQSQKYSHN